MKIESLNQSFANLLTSLKRLLMKRLAETSNLCVLNDLFAGKTYIAFSKCVVKSTMDDFSETICVYKRDFA